ARTSGPPGRLPREEDQRPPGSRDLPFRPLGIARPGRLGEWIVFWNESVFGSPAARTPAATRQPKFEGDIEGGPVHARLAAGNNLREHGQLLLGPERLHYRLVCGQVRTFDEVNAIRDGGENGEQAITEGARLAWEID